MERCPNCGAPARSGAKFCTTCGYRLTDEDAAPAADDTADASLGESTVAGDAYALAWPPSDATTAPAEGDPDGTDPSAAASSIAEIDAGPNDPEPADDAADPAPADQVLSSSWPTPASESSAWSREWGTATAAPEPRVLDTPSPFNEGIESSSESSVDAAVSWPPSMPNVSSHAADDALLASSGDGSATSPDDAPPRADDLLPALVDPPRNSPGEDDRPVLAAIHPEFTATPEARPVVPAAGAVPPWATAEGVDHGEQSDLDRVLTLLDQLRLIVPRLSTPPPTVDADLVADALEQSVAPVDDQPSDFADLRAAMEAARDRPRDIDTVLALSRRVDDVLELIDAHDRAVAAVRLAVASLRPAPLERP